MDSSELSGQNFWPEVPDLVMPTGPAPTTSFCCTRAEHLAVYATRLYDGLRQLSDKPSAAQVEHAEVGYREACFLLQQRWFEIRSVSPKAHQDKIRDANGDLCTYGVYVAALSRFLDFRNQIAPPPLAVRPRQPARRDQREQHGPGLAELLLDFGKK